MPTTDELVQRRAPEIARVIQTAAEGSPLEADFRRPVEEALAQFADETGVPLRTHHEYTLATGRADTVYNRLVVEYKRPGHLSEYRSNRNNVAAVGEAGKPFPPTYPISTRVGSVNGLSEVVQVRCGLLVLRSPLGWQGQLTKMRVSTTIWLGMLSASYSPPSEMIVR